MNTNERDRDNQRLQALLNAPKTPADLAVKLKANLDHQIFRESAPVGRSSLRQTRVYAVAAGVILAIVLALPFKSKPDLISVAQAHASEEAQLSGAADGGYQSWFDALGLRVPTEAKRVSLSKNCVLGELPAKHLRFDLANSGTINLFIYKGAEGVPVLQAANGSSAGQSWITASPRDDIHLLALYDEKVTQAEVNRIIFSIFKAPSA